MPQAPNRVLPNVYHRSGQPPDMQPDAILRSVEPGSHNATPQSHS